MNAPAGGRAATAALADFITLNEELAAIVRARLPLELHLSKLGRELPGKAGDLAERIGKRMEAGESLAVAMDAECAELPAAYRAAIIAGAQSGELGAALESLVDSASRVEQMRRVTGLAILYPLVVAVVACVLLAVVATIVIPNFEWLNEKHFSYISRLAHWRWTVPVFAVLVPSAITIAAVIWWWRTGKVSGGLPRFSAAWLPGSRRVRRWSNAATFVELLRLMVERGLPLDYALRLAGESSPDANLRTNAERLSAQIGRGNAQALAIGSKSGDAFADFPLLIRVALHHANDRALLVSALKQAANMYRERAVRAAEWYAEFMPIILTVAVGGTLTFGFAMVVLWPYVSTLKELSGWHWR